MEVLLMTFYELYHVASSFEMLWRIETCSSFTTFFFGP
jgi:hypothetical protein